MSLPKSGFKRAAVAGLTNEPRECILIALLRSHQGMGHLHACLLRWTSLRLLLTGLVLGLLQVTQQAFAMVPDAAKLALDATSKGLPLMARGGCLAQKVLQDFLLLLNEGNFLLDLILLPLEEMSLVFEQDAISLPCTEQNGVGIIIDMRLRIQNLCGFEKLPSAICQLLSVRLGDPSQIVLLQFFLGEQQRPNMIKVLKFQPSEEVREGLEGNMWLPVRPCLSVIQSHRSLLNDMQSQLFHGVEDRPVLGGRAWADA